MYSMALPLYYPIDFSKGSVSQLRGSSSLQTFSNSITEGLSYFIGIK